MSDLTRWMESQNWVTRNPVLGSGQVGFERDTGKSKIGDGSTKWNALPYTSNDPYVTPPAADAGSLFVTPSNSSILLGAKRPESLLPSLRTGQRIAGAGHGWTGTNTADDITVKMLGDRSLKLTPPANTSATATSPVFTAQDWSKGAVRLIIRLDDFTKLNFYSVLITTGVGNTFNSNGLSQHAGYVAGDWMIITIPRAHFTPAGSPTWAGVTQVAVTVKSNAGVTVVANIHGVDLIQDKAEVYPNGVFVLEADDGYPSQKSLLLPLVESLGIPLTLPLIIDRIINNQASMSVADLKAFERAGHQLASHAYASAFHDNAAATIVEAEADFIAQQRWYDDNGLSFGALDYALCPGTGSPVADSNLKNDALRRRFRSIRVNSGYYETANPSNPYRLRSLLYANDTAVLTTHINKQSVPGGAFIFAMHGVVAGSTNGTDSGLSAPAINNLKTALQLAASNGMAFRTRADYVAGR